MSIYLTRAQESSGYFEPARKPTTSAPRKPSFWRNMLEAMQASRKRAAEREIVKFLDMAGPWNDSVERELERRFAAHQLKDL